MGSFSRTVGCYGYPVVKVTHRGETNPGTVNTLLMVSSGGEHSYVHLNIAAQSKKLQRHSGIMLLNQVS